MKKVSTQKGIKKGRESFVQCLWITHQKMAGEYNSQKNREMAGFKKFIPHRWEKSKKDCISTRNEI